MNLLEEIIGEDAYAKLLVYAGGTDYHIPSRLESAGGQRLVAWIGEPAAKKMIDWGEGSTVYVSGRASRVFKQRLAFLRQRRAEGATLAELSRITFQVRLSDRQLRRLLNEYDHIDTAETRPADSLDLFGDT